MVYYTNMNIFILDNSPVKSAQYQADKHVVKMILETAQMLSTVHRVLDGSEYKAPSKSGKTMRKAWRLDTPNENILYSVTHLNHPCTQWAMQSSSNYQWLYDHFVALCDEYTYRYGKTHMTDTKLRDALSMLPKHIPIGQPTPFVQAMPEDVKNADPVTAYRNYYIQYKNNIVTWNKTRPQPTWYKETI